MSFQWNYGDIIEAMETITPPEHTALIHGKRTITWGDMQRRTNNLANNLLADGVEPGDKIAFYMRNCPEYSEGINAAFKARLTHVNVNYRYIDRELIYLLDNSDASVVIYHSEFQPQVDTIRDQLPGVRHWLAVDDGKPSAYERMAETGTGEPVDLTRSPEDLLFLYTGGTTGMPKGVMWQHHDLYTVLGAGGNWRIGIPPCKDLQELLQRTQQQPRPVNMPLPPIMHGTGLLSAIGAMTNGGTCVTLPDRSFNADTALEAIDSHKVTAVTIVGDAFARPMVEALNANPGRFDISSLKVMNSSGVMWTREVKAGLLHHHGELILSDGFSSSEAIGLGSSTMTKDQEIDVAKFALGPHCKVFSEDFRELKPGSAEAGVVAVSGNIPVGYYKDQEKTDKTFKLIDGTRYSIPGDWVRVEDDGSLTLLGRGSNCINTAGEKVYPEEVEEALKFHQGVADALVVGIDDERWGQSITAVVQMKPGFDLDENEMREFSRSHLAAYKIPKRILSKTDLERAPNGKADYKTIRVFAETTLASQ